MAVNESNTNTSHKDITKTIQGYYLCIWPFQPVILKRLSAHRTIDMMDSITGITA